MKNEILTQARLKELLHYNPDTGVFTWIDARNGTVKIGDIAGCIDKGKGKKTAYLRIVVDGHTHKAHRLAFLYVTGSFPSKLTDHDDGDGLNNKWKNINNVDNSSNRRNVSRQKNNKSGCMGICFDPEQNKWLTQIHAGGRQIKVGRYHELWLAICARKSAENKYGYHVNHGRVASDDIFGGNEFFVKPYHPRNKLLRSNKSGCNGVSFDKQANKWSAAIRVDGKQKRLGRFVEIWEAISARKSAEVKYDIYRSYDRKNEI